MNQPALEPAALESQRKLLSELVPAFDESWKTGGRPAAESLLADPRVIAAGASFGRVLLRDLLQIEIFRRKRLGESPAVEEFLARFPDQTGLIAECLSAEISTLGEYTLLRKIGSGGMGDVYLAVNNLTGKSSALKLIRGNLAGDAQAIDRFKREIRSLSSLNHKNIVGVITANRADEVLYLEMEYIAGHNLDQIRSRAGNFSAAEACAAICQAADGLAYAHEQQVLHRDLKPHNLMLTKDGTVKILDFGLAKLRSGTPASGEPSFATSHGAVVGTPRFMAPEQLDAGSTSDVRTDVYSLGATLYYLLSGQTPHRGATILELIKTLATQPPEPLANLRPDLPAELCSRVMKMMASNVEDRYGSMDEVRQALSPFAVEANLPALFHRAQSSVAGPPGSILPSRPLDPTQPIQSSAAAPAKVDQVFVSTDRVFEKTAPIPPRSSVSSAKSPRAHEAGAPRNPGKSHRWIMAGGVALVLAILGTWCGVTMILESRKGRIVVECQDPTVQLRVKQNGKLVKGVRIESLKGKRLVRIYAGEYELELDAADTDRFELQDKTVTVIRGQEARVKITSTSERRDQKPGLAKPGTEHGPKAKELVGTVQFPDKAERISSPWALITAAPQSAITAVAWSPDGGSIAYGMREGEVRICQADSLKTTAFLRGHRGVINGIAWRPDGLRVASCSSDRTVRIWDSTGKLLQTMERSGLVLAVAWQPNGQKLAALENSGIEGLDKGQGVIWDGEGKELASFGVDKWYGTEFAWSANGRRLAFAGAEKKVRFWTEEGARDGETDASPAATGSLDWSTLGVLAATGGLTKTVALRTPASDRWEPVDLASGNCSHVDWSPDGHWLSVSTSQGLCLAKFGELKDGKQPLLLKGIVDVGLYGALAWHPRENKLVTAGDSLATWTLNEEKALSAVAKQSMSKATLLPIHIISRQPKGKQFGVAGGDGLAALFDESGKQLAELPGHTGAVNLLAWSFDGEWLATGGQDKSVRFWTRHGEAGKSYADSEFSINYLAWARTSLWLAAAENGRFTRLYHPTLGPGAIMENQNTVFSLSWSRKDERIATGLANLAGIQFWDKSEDFRTFESLPGGARDGLRDHVATLEYCPTGDRLAAGSAYGRAILLDHESKTVTPLLTRGEKANWLHAGSVTKVSWNHQGDRLATADNFGILGLWSAQGEHLGTWQIGNYILELAWSPDDRYLAAGDGIGYVWIWDSNRNTTKSVSGNLSAVRSLAWNAESSRLMIGTSGGMLRVFSVEKDQVLSTTMMLPGKKVVALNASGDLVQGKASDLQGFLFRVASPEGRDVELTPEQFAERKR